MKLRNNKTGIVIDTEIADIKFKSGKIIIIPEPIKLNGLRYSYESLSKLKEDWEDYKPTEPALKDKKICKFVSDWATLAQTTKILVVNRRNASGEKFTEFFSQERRISLEIMGRFGLSDMKEYDLTELCG